MELASYNHTLEMYKNIVMISDYIVRIGAVGTLLIGFIYGFFKHRWVIVKWILFIIQTLIGIFVVDELMMENMTLLGSQALDHPDFIENHVLRQNVVYLQVTITIFIFVISVLRPWKKKKRQ